jgi:hypothetical protein
MHPYNTKTNVYKQHDLLSCNLSTKTLSFRFDKHLSSDYN